MGSPRHRRWPCPKVPCLAFLGRTQGTRDRRAAPLVGMDVHGIPPKKREPYHLHHDLIFAFRAESDAIQITPEARQVAWCLPAELSRYGVAQSIIRSVDRAINSKCT